MSIDFQSEVSPKEVLGIDIGGTGIKAAPVNTETGTLLADVDVQICAAQRSLGCISIKLQKDLTAGARAVPAGAFCCARRAAAAACSQRSSQYKHCPNPIIHSLSTLHLCKVCQCVACHRFARPALQRPPKTKATVT